MIIENSATCKKCGDSIFSRNRHDFVTCKCGAISVDGGQEYIRRVGDLKDIDDTAWSAPEKLYEACADAAEFALESGCNSYGIANAVMRTMRQFGRVIADGERSIMAAHKDELMIVEPDGITTNRYKKVVDV